MVTSRASLDTRRRVAHERAVAEPLAARALYVASDLRCRTNAESDPYATDIAIEGVVYRRVDPAYLAWLLHRIDKAPEACEAGRISVEAFETMCARFASIYAWAVEAWGTDAVDRAELDTNVRSYVPPRKVHW